MSWDTAMTPGGSVAPCGNETSVLAEPEVAETRKNTVTGGSPGKNGERSRCRFSLLIPGPVHPGCGRNSAID